MKRYSLRARLIAGVLVWTAGLLIVTTTIAITVIIQHPKSSIPAHRSLLTFIGAALVIAGVFAIHRGLLSIGMLRQRLAAVHDGRSARIDGGYPSEVAPLVDDLNALLDEREQRIALAVAKAGDLAHGLKTPLAILVQDIERTDVAGQHERATSMREQVERMRRQIESHLAHVRARASGHVLDARANVEESVRGLARAMERLYADRALVIAIDTSAEHVVRVPMQDLDEMLGSLLDNACRFATTRVDVSSAVAGAQIVIDIDDDGPGQDSLNSEHVLRRGIPWDDTVHSPDLGLAIARDLAEAYGGALILERSRTGGVRAEVTLPAQPHIGTSL